jgi:hypothetical protein
VFFEESLAFSQTPFIGHTELGIAPQVPSKTDTPHHMSIAFDIGSPSVGIVITTEINGEPFSFPLEDHGSALGHFIDCPERRTSFRRKPESMPLGLNVIHHKFGDRIIDQVILQLCSEVSPPFLVRQTIIRIRLRK